MPISRNEFLRLSSWGAVASLLPIHQLSALSKIKNYSANNQNDYTLAVGKAKEAKVAFFKKEYALAESLYLECISLAPADIRFYDNLQNVYGAQGQWMASIELFKNGLIANSEKISFFDRAARSLMRLELGSKTLAAQYRDEVSTKSLLNDAKVLYEKGLGIDSAMYLKIGLEKVKKKIKEDATNIDYRKSKEAKLERQYNRKKHNTRYDELSISDLENKLISIDNSKRYTLYFQNQHDNRKKNINKEKKLIHRMLSRNYQKDNDIDNAIKHTIAILDIDGNDSRAIQKLKRLYTKKNNYSALVDLRRNQISIKETVYGYLGLIKTLHLMYNEYVNDQSLLEESKQISNHLLKEWDLKGSIKVKVIDKLCDTYILERSFSSAKDIITTYIDEKPKLSDGDINSLIYSYAKAHFFNDKFDSAISILNIGIDKASSEERQDFPSINNLAQIKKEFIIAKDLKLYYLMYRVYEVQNDTNNMTNIIEFLLKNNPKDQFALKHQNN